MLTDTSFHVKVINDEIITYYEAVPGDACFNLAYNSVIFASVMLQGHWQQTSGIKLPAQQLLTIGKQISRITRRQTFTNTKTPQATAL
ncbi:MULTISPECIES: hypothetical protein [Mucilaginibacter]|uniref:hypothetical protein n=1 Tax=Mucilaginibacter TaxID=423349 RepID=UPI002093C02E|nr:MULTISPECIES: hypothetical protein [Mucilaginibacter]MCO5948364.1 hypothetical protein [Mucilaginibacter flavidus]